MASKKFGAVMAAKVPGSYFTLSQAEQEAPGNAVGELMAKYADKVTLESLLDERVHGGGL